MKIKHLIGVLTLLVALSTTASAEEFYVGNRPFKDVVVSSGQAYVSAQAFFKATGFGWNQSGDTVVLEKGRGGSSIEGGNLRLKMGSKTLAVEGLNRAGEAYIPLRPVAKFLGFGVIYNTETGIVDVYQGHMITNDEEKAAEEVAQTRTEEEKKLQEAWEKRLEKIKADRAAKEAEEAAEAGEEVEVDSEDGAASTDSGEGEDLKSYEDDPAEDIKGEPDAESYEDEPADTKPADEETKPAEKEEKPKEADLVILNRSADPNYYTGDISMTATIENQGYANASNVRASLKLIGPDKRVWWSKTSYHNGVLAEDKTWDIKETWRHPVQGSMPRGDLDFQVQLFYDKK